MGRSNLTYATFGIGGTKEQAQRAIDEGRSSGFRTQAEWDRYFRERRPVGPLASPMTTAPSVRRGNSNVLLQAVWGGPERKIVMDLQTAVGNLTAALDAGLPIDKIEAVLGDKFAEALAEAVRRKLVVIATDKSGKPRLWLAKPS